jgi:hypothetical protein
VQVDAKAQLNENKSEQVNDVLVFPRFVLPSKPILTQAPLFENIAKVKRGAEFDTLEGCTENTVVDV